MKRKRRMGCPRCSARHTPSRHSGGPSGEGKSRWHGGPGCGWEPRGHVGAVGSVAMPTVVLGASGWRGGGKGGEQVWEEESRFLAQVTCTGWTGVCDRVGMLNWKARPSMGGGEEVVLWEIRG